MAEVACLEGRLRFHAWITAGEYFGDSAEDMVEAQAVTNFMDHRVCVAQYAVVGRIQHYSACVVRKREKFGLFICSKPEPVHKEFNTSVQFIFTIKYGNYLQKLLFALLVLLPKS